MDDKEYLKHISSTVRPTKKAKMNFVSSPIFKVGLIGLIGVIFIVIIGSIISGGKADIKTQLVKLKFHLDNTSSVITTYQKNVKSSSLRSSSASLNSALTNIFEGALEYLSALSRIFINT